MTKGDCLAHRHLGIITKVCYKYWRLLPAHVHGHLDLETMIMDTIGVVTRDGARYYNATKAKESTFVYLMAESYGRNVLTRYKLGKRAANGMLQLDQPAPGEETPVYSRKDRRHLSLDPVEAYWLDSKKALECLLLFASEELRAALDAFFNTRKFSVFREGHLTELRSLAVSHGVTREDFAAALQIA
jgi:hypothetical protein